MKRKETQGDLGGGHTDRAPQKKATSSTAKKGEIKDLKKHHWGGLLTMRGGHV